LSLDEEELAGPQWLAHRFDEKRNEIRFVEHDRAARASVPFLTDSYLPPKPFRAETRERALRLAPARTPIHFLFHSGFCCSTLFASCFDQPGLATTFSEPMILNDVTGWRQRGAAPAEVGRLLGDALGLLARPFEGDQAALVKPSTVVNGLASAMLGVRPQARALVMYAPLTDFLTSIAKKGIDGRLWSRELFLAMRKERLIDELGFTDEQFFGQTDLQVAAAAWLGQQRLFDRLLQVYPERVRSMDSNRFLKNPADAMAATGVLFGLHVSPAQIAAARAGPLSRNSKDGKPFSRSAREAEYRAAKSAHRDEIEKVCTWAAAVGEAAGIPTDLPNPLI
jgi:hypothetical protein